MAFSVSTSWAMAIACATPLARKRASSFWATVTLVPCEKLRVQATSISGCDEPVSGEKHRRVAIGGAADHDAVDPVEVALGGAEAGDAAVENDLQGREIRLQAVDVAVTERRDFAVLRRAQPLENGDARVHGEAADAHLGDAPDERLQVLVGAAAVDADAAFDGDREVDRPHHRRDTVRHQSGPRHQGSAEAATPHAGAGAADIEVDLVVAEGLADLGRAGEHARLRAAELQGERTFRLVEAEQPGTVAVQHRLRSDHLAVEKRPGGNQAQEVAPVPVGARHHRRDAQPAVQPVHRDPRRALARNGSLTPCDACPIESAPAPI